MNDCSMHKYSAVIQNFKTIETTGGSAQLSGSKPTRSFWVHIIPVHLRQRVNLTPFITATELSEESPMSGKSNAMGMNQRSGQPDISHLDSKSPPREDIGYSNERILSGRARCRIISPPVWDTISSNFNPQEG